jgi:hypothetical protein
MAENEKTYHHSTKIILFINRGQYNKYHYLSHLPSRLEILYKYKLPTCVGRNQFCKILGSHVGTIEDNHLHNLHSPVRRHSQESLHYLTVIPDKCMVNPDRTLLTLSFRTTQSFCTHHTHNVLHYMCCLTSVSILLQLSFCLHYVPMC